MAAPKAVCIELLDTEGAELASRSQRRKVARGDARRAEIVLLAAEEVSNLAIAERLGITRVTAATWRRRFAERRLIGPLNEPRPGAPRTVTDQKVAIVATATLETLPVGRTHWTRGEWCVHRDWRHQLCSGYGGRSRCSRTAARPLANACQGFADGCSVSI